MGSGAGLPISGGIWSPAHRWGSPQPALLETQSFRREEHTSRLSSVGKRTSLARYAGVFVRERKTMVRQWFRPPRGGPAGSLALPALDAPSPALRTPSPAPPHQLCRPSPAAPRKAKAGGAGPWPRPAVLGLVSPRRKGRRCPQGSLARRSGRAWLSQSKQGARPVPSLRKRLALLQAQFWKRFDWTPFFCPPPPSF